MLSIGQIGYANCVPVFSEFMRRHAHEYRFVQGVPATLNEMLRVGAIDLSPSSSIEYARHAERYLLFPDISISSIGEVKSVLLFSLDPIEQLDTASISLTGESATSVILLRILLQKYLGYTNTYNQAESGSGAPSRGDRALLLIGDAALESARSEQRLYRYDLGSLWFEQTGLPFVFALWIIREEALKREGEAVIRCSADFIAAKREAKSHYRSLAETMPSAVLPPDELAAYWETISYELTDAHILGLNRFFSDAVEIGALENQPALRFIDNG